MRILTCNSLSNSDIGGWCEYAVLELYDATIRDILARRELFQTAHRRDKDLWSMVFWGIPGEFYDDLPLDDLLNDDQRAGFETDQYLVLPEEFSLTEDPKIKAVVEAARTECDRLVIEETLFYFKAIVKHTDVYVETPGLKYELLLPTEKK